MSQIELLDLADVEILEEVEQAFDIKITDAEAAACLTVGSLFSLILNKTTTVERSNLPCPSAWAYWRIRSALRQMTSDTDLAPSKCIADLMPSTNHRAWWRELERLTELRLPSAIPPKKRWLRRFVSTTFGILLGLVVFAFGGGFISASICAAVALVLALYLASAQADVLGMDAAATLGDLAKVTASLNVGAFIHRQGSIRTTEAWIALETVIRYSTQYAGPIDKRTTFKCV